MSIKRLRTGPRMSQVVVHGSTIYLAGQVADQAKGKRVGDQTKEILAAIDRLLAEAGSAKPRYCRPPFISPTSALSPK